VVLPALAAAALTLAGCGGGGGDELEHQIVQGRGFSFAAPADWQLKVGARSSSAEAGAGDPELVSVTVYRLARPYRPALWKTVVPELDRVAGELASRLGGTLASSATVVVDGRRARSYEIRYGLEGEGVVERTAFVLDGRREYQLICRYRSGEPPPACDTLFETFRLA
jgi:hypothetical protein